MRSSVKLLILVMLAAVGLTACGSHPVAYAPVAYGQNSQCYYLDDPQEAIALQHAGLCGPQGNYWVPTLMPLLWHEMYYPYYSSSAYYGTYVVASHRTVFISHQTTFSHTYASEIKTQSAKAKYKGSNGKTYTGNKIKKGSFSNGVKGFGGGKKCSLGAPLGVSLTKGGGGSSGGSRSGGSRSGGSKGFGSGSKGSGSKSRKSGC
jgi:hypothetical protein